MDRGDGEMGDGGSMHGWMDGGGSLMMEGDGGGIGGGCTHVCDLVTQVRMAGPTPRGPRCLATDGDQFSASVRKVFFSFSFVTRS